MTFRELARRTPGARRVYRALHVKPVAPRWYAGLAWKKIRIDRDVDGFSDLARRTIAAQRTSLDYDRLYTLWQAVRDMRTDAQVVEVGVYKGGSARFLAESMRQLGKTGELYACDTFSGHAVVDPRLDGGHKVNEGFSDVVLAEVQAYLAGQSNIHIVVGDITTGDDAIPEAPIGLLHVDVDVYPATRYCLKHFGSRVIPGGAIVVDDYGFTTCVGAKVAVDEFYADTTDWRMFHLLTGQALLIRV